MKPRIVYRMSYKNFEEQLVFVDISDNSVMIDDDQDQILIDLVGAETPLKRSVVDNSENKFTPILATKLTIRFLNSTNINYETFSQGEENRFPVEAWVDHSGVKKYFFKGYLEQSSIIEPFLPQINEDVQLIAIDGLAWLKNIPLTNFDGNTPIDKHRLIDFIAWSLSKTRQSLNINVIDNTREQNSPYKWSNQINFINSTSRISTFFSDDPFYKVGHQIRFSNSVSNNITFTLVDRIGPGEYEVSPAPTDELAGPMVTVEDLTDGGNFYATSYHDAKTYEDEIGTCENCYSVLEKILGSKAFLTQCKGEWLIYRVAEFRNDFIGYMTTFDFEGTFQEVKTVNFEKAIGLNELSGATPVPFPGNPDATGYLSDEETTRSFARPNKRAELYYNYETWRELLCNIDFSRGDFIADLPNETVEGVECTVKKYNLDCWTLERGFAGAPPTSEAYIKKYFNNIDYEKLRFALITVPPEVGIPPLNHIRSSAIDISVKDKFTWSFDFSAAEDNDSDEDLEMFVGACILYGDDGSYWVLGDNFPGGVPEWKVSNATFSINFDVYQWAFNPSEVDLTEWQSYSIESAPAPVSGKLHFILFASSNSVSEVHFDMRYQNLSFEYIPFINGSYRKYKGHSNKSTRTGEYSSVSETRSQIFSSDSPKQIFKGALLVKNGTNYPLAQSFYDGQEFLLANDGLNNLMSYGKLQEIAFFNQYRNGSSILYIKCQGLDSGAVDANGFCDAMDLIHRYFIRDLEPATNNHPYRLVTMEQDWKLCELKATIIKIFDNTIGFIKDDPYEFRYIS